MSKYNSLWEYIQEQRGQTLQMSFAEIGTIGENYVYNLCLCS